MVSRAVRQYFFRLSIRGPHTGSSFRRASHIAGSLEEIEEAIVDEASDGQGLSFLVVEGCAFELELYEDGNLCGVWNLFPALRLNVDGTVLSFSKNGRPKKVDAMQLVNDVLDGEVTCTPVVDLGGLGLPTPRGKPLQAGEMVSFEREGRTLTQAYGATDEWDATAQADEKEVTKKGARKTGTKKAAVKKPAKAGRDAAPRVVMTGSKRRPSGDHANVLASGSIRLVPLQASDRKVRRPRLPLEKKAGLVEVCEWPGGIALGLLSTREGLEVVVQQGSSRHRTGVVLRQVSYAAASSVWQGRPCLYVAGYHERDLWRVDVATGRTVKAITVPPDESGITDIVPLATGDILLAAGVIVWTAPDGENLRLVARLDLLPSGWGLGTVGEGRALIAIGDPLSGYDLEKTRVWVLARDGEVIRVLAYFERADVQLRWEPGSDAQVEEQGVRRAVTGVADALADVARHDQASLYAPPRERGLHS